MSGALHRFHSALAAGAFGLMGLTACEDHAVNVLPPPDTVLAVTITPPSANLNVGEQLTLVATVPASIAQTSRGVVWTSSNTAVATVDGNGRVTAIGGGTNTIVATSVANSSVKGAAAITVGSVGSVPRILAINQDGKAVVLSNISGRIDVVVAIPPSPPAFSTVDVLLNFGAADTVVATQSVAATVPAEQSITLSVNTAALKNGPCILKVRATTTNGTIVGSSATPITLNNPPSP